MSCTKSGVFLRFPVIRCFSVFLGPDKIWLPPRSIGAFQNRIDKNVILSFKRRNNNISALKRYNVHWCNTIQGNLVVCEFAMGPTNWNQETKARLNERVASNINDIGSLARHVIRSSKSTDVCHFIF